MLVAIGHDDGGDVLVLKPMDGDPTTLEHVVYWWDHETSELHVVVDNFNEFNKLKNSNSLQLTTENDVY